MDKIEKFNIDSAVRYGKLPSGLVYYIRHNETPRSTACIYLVKKVGSVMEEDNESGFSHFLEHMSFNGMDGFPARTVIERLETSGVRFGEEFNAYTNTNETVYMINNIPSTDVELSFDILSGFISRLHLTDESIESERGVVLDEFNVTSSPVQRMIEKMMPRLYSGSKYGYRPVLGSKDVIASFPCEDLRRYYRKWSRPDLSAIIAVGDFDANAVENQIKKIQLPTCDTQPQNQEIEVPDNDEPLFLVERDPEMEYTVVMLLIKYDKHSPQMADSYEALKEDYIKELVQQILQSRLSYIAEGTDAPFLDVETSLRFFMSCSSKRSMEIISSTDDPHLSLAALFRELRRAGEYGFTQSELEKAKQGRTNVFLSNYLDRAKRTSESYCKEYVRHFTRQETIPSIEDEYEFFNKTIAEITLDDVSSVARELFSGRNMVVCSFLPQSVQLCEEDVKKIYSAVSKESLTPFQIRCLSGPLIKNLPPPGNIVSLSDSMYGYKRIVLSNGSVVYHKETDFSDDNILIKCFRKKGRLHYSSELRRELSVLDGILTIGGLGEYDSRDFYSVTENYQIDFSSTLGTALFSLKGSSSKKDFERLLELLYLQFTAMKRDDKAFAKYCRILYGKLKMEESSPLESVMKLCRNLTFTDDDSILSDEIGQIDYAKTFQIATELFSDASSFVFIITGRITSDELTPLLKRYIATLPSTYSNDTIKKISVLPSVYEINRKELVTPASYSYSCWICPYEQNLKSLIVSQIADFILNTELHDGIRVADGDIYNIQSSNTLYSLSCYAAVYLLFQSSVGREEEIHAEIDAIINRLSTTSPTPESLNQARQYLQKKHAADLRSDKYFQENLVNMLLYGDDQITTFTDTLNNITGEDIRKFFSTLLVASNLHRAVILPL